MACLQEDSLVHSSFAKDNLFQHSTGEGRNGGSQTALLRLRGRALSPTRLLGAHGAVRVYTVIAGDRLRLIEAVEVTQHGGIICVQQNIMLQEIIDIVLLKASMLRTVISALSTQPIFTDAKSRVSGLGRHKY